MAMFNVRMAAIYSYVEHILGLSNILNLTFLTFDHIGEILGFTVSSSFDSKGSSHCHAVK